MNTPRSKGPESQKDTQEALVKEILSLQRLEFCNKILKILSAVVVALGATYGIDRYFAAKDQAMHEARLKQREISTGEYSRLSPERDIEVVKDIQALATLLRGSSQSSLNPKILPILFIEKAALETLREDFPEAIKTLDEALNLPKNALDSKAEFDLLFTRATKYRKMADCLSSFTDPLYTEYAKLAVDDLSRCMTLFPEDIATYLEMGKNYRQMKEFDTAKRYLEYGVSLLKQNPQEGDSYEHLEEDFQRELHWANSSFPF